MFVSVENREVLGYFVIAGLLAILLYLAWKVWKYVKLYAEFPTFSMMFYVVYSITMNKIPKNLPFAAFFFQKLTLLAQKYHKEGLFMFWSPEPLLIIFGVDTVKALINEKEILAKPNKYAFLRDFFGTGLLTSDVDTWRKHRKLLNPVFHLGMLKHKMHIFNDNADTLVKKLEEEVLNGNPFDAIDLFKTCVFSVLCQYVFGLERNVSEDKELMKIYFTKLKAGTEMIVNNIGQPWLQFKFLRKFLPSGRKYVKLIDYIGNISMEFISAMKEKIILQRAEITAEDADWKDDMESRKSFAHILLDHHLKDNSFTMDDIKYQVSTFIPAGLDTVSHTVLWSLFLLGHDPDIQNTVYDEVSTLLDGPIKYEDLQNLVYLECVIKETMRLFPPVALYGRKVNKDMQCGKYIVPKGTDVAVFVYMLHRNPRVYPNPEKFDPERFQEVDSFIRAENYIPFGHGIRNCIGKGFAMIELKVILASILRHFRITSLERREDVDITWNIALLPVKPLHFRFTPRNHEES